MEEKKSWNGEENNEEKGCCEACLGWKKALFGLGVGSHIGGKFQSMEKGVCFVFEAFEKQNFLGVHLMVLGMWV